MKRPLIAPVDRAAYYQRLASDLRRSAEIADQHGLAEVAKSQRFAAKICEQESARECGQESAHV